MGLIAGFGLVFLLLGICLRTLKRVHDGGMGRSGLRMEVVQRVTVGPKQGIAVVRIGERLVAVSLGDGGVRPLLELGEEEKAAVAAAALLPQAPIVAIPHGLQALLGARTGLAIERGLARVGIRTAGVLLAPLARHSRESGNSETGAGALAAAKDGPALDPHFRGDHRGGADRARLDAAGTAAVAEPGTIAGSGRDAIATRAAALRQRHSPLHHLPVRVPDLATAPLRSRDVNGFDRGAEPARKPRGSVDAGARDAAERTSRPNAPAAAATQSFGSILRQVAAERFRTALGGAARTALLLLLASGIAVVADVSVASAQANAEVASAVAQADTMLTRLAPEIDVRVGDAAGGLRLSGTVGVVVMMGLLTLLPTLVLMMTSFTRIFIVLGFLRQALGTQSAPPGHLMAALALLLTGFVMAPTLSEVNKTALEPWMAGQIEQGEMLATAAGPFRTFMLGETRDNDLQTFLDMSETPEVERAEDVPMVVLMSAFVTSELRTAFQIGFALFLPFIVIDVVVASVLMSMGMMMLPPPMIALPFKILLFVLVDGWTLIVQGLVSSFH